jgi:16S rRNA (uracil1498-N3)-methyltransferase
LRTVLRAQPGERLLLLDGAGAAAEAELLPGDDRRRGPLGCRIVERRQQAPPSTRLHLFLAPPRPKPMSLLVRQATELGVWAVHPLLTTRGVSKPAAEAVAGWEEDARQACKQSGNPWLPAISPPRPLAAVLAAGPPPGYLGCPATAAAGPTAWPVAGIPDIALWIGPEGGFTAAEEAAILAGGAVPLTIGRHILRVETAVVAALALLIERTSP